MLAGEFGSPGANADNISPKLARGMDDCPSGCTVCTRAETNTQELFSEKVEGTRPLRRDMVKTNPGDWYLSAAFRDIPSGLTNNL